MEDFEYIDVIKKPEDEREYKDSKEWARVAKQQEGDLSGVCLHSKLFKIPILQIIT